MYQVFPEFPGLLTAADALHLHVSSINPLFHRSFHRLLLLFAVKFFHLKTALKCPFIKVFPGYSPSNFRSDSDQVMFENNRFQLHQITNSLYKIVLLPDALYRCFRISSECLNEPAIADPGKMIRFPGHKYPGYKIVRAYFQHNKLIYITILALIQPAPEKNVNCTGTISTARTTKKRWLLLPPLYFTAASLILILSYTYKMYFVPVPLTSCTLHRLRYPRSQLNALISLISSLCSSLSLMSCR